MIGSGRSRFEALPASIRATWMDIEREPDGARTSTWVVIPIADRKRMPTRAKPPSSRDRPDRDRHSHDRKPRRMSPGRDGEDDPVAEVEHHLHQIAQSHELLFRSYARLAELVGELLRPDGRDAPQASRYEQEPPRERPQPTVELPSAAQSSTLALEQALTMDVDERAKDYLAEAVELFEDADRGIPELRDHSMRARSAFLAIWAGRGRALQARLEPWWNSLPEGVEKSFRVFFGKLTTVTKRLRCEWVDALHRAWSTDWDVYVRFYQRRLVEELPGYAIEFVPLTLDEDQMLARDRLTGLLQRSRPRPSDARQLILEAAEVLDATDDVMSDVLHRNAALLRGHEDFVALLHGAGIDPEGEVYDGDDGTDGPGDDDGEQLEE